MADENTEIQEQQTQETTPQQQGIQFEDILPWGTTGGDTGLSSRLKLKRNFEKIKAWMDSFSQYLNLDDKYLSKQKDDEANGLITFLKGIKIGVQKLFGWDSNGDITANNISANDLSASSIRTDDIRSENYSGDGMADSGYRITSSWGNTTDSGAVFDYLTVRKKMIINSLEIKEEEFSAGDQAFTGANAKIARTDYMKYDQTSGKWEVIGYSTVRVPWLLRGIPLLLSHFSKGLGRKMYSRLKKVRMTLTTEQLREVGRIRCYFLANDGDREIENWWRVNDLARCQTQNLIGNQKRETYADGQDTHLGNIYYWRKVVRVSVNTGTQSFVWQDDDGNISQTYIEGYRKVRGYNGTVAGESECYPTPAADYGEPVTIDGKKYHWFEVSYDYAAELDAFSHGRRTSWCDLYSDIPAVSDKVVQFGNTTDPDRMNVMTFEVNGSGNGDAPALKIYRGIYTFDKDLCWWGGNPRKVKISPATGYEFYGPMFKFVQEYGKAMMPIMRPEKYWTRIAFERDDEQKQSYPAYSDDVMNSDTFVSRADTTKTSRRYVRKCYYYDEVTHNGSLWMCSITEQYYWRWEGSRNLTYDSVTYEPGDRIPDGLYNSLSYSDKEMCSRVRSYATSEPSEASNEWTLIVEKGDEGSSPISAYRWYEDGITPDTPAARTEDPAATDHTSDGKAYPADKWSKSAPNRQSEGWNLWMITSTKFGDGTVGAWSTPVRISGDKGTPGEDGSDMEYIYILKTSEYTFPTAEKPANISRGKVHGQGEWIPKADQYTTDDWVPEGWSDNPQGIDSTNKFEYMSWRRKPKGSNTWGAFQDPIIWSHWGRNGMDGDGTEYVFIRTKNNVEPIIADEGTSYLADEWRPYISNGAACEAETTIESGSTVYRTTDDPKGTNDTYKYEWVAKRNMTTANPTTGERTWKSYRDCIGSPWKMSKWANYAESALVIDITNDNDQFGVDAEGKVLVQQTPSTVVSMLYGTQEQAFSSTPSATLKYDDGTTVAGTVATVGVEVVPNTSNKEYTVTVTIKATGSNTPVFGSSGKNGLYVDISGTCVRGTKAIRFTLEKVMSGAKGESPEIYQLNPTLKSLSFTRDASNDLTPSSRTVTVNVLKTVGNTTTEHTSAITGVTYDWGFENESTAASGHSGCAIGSSFSISNTDAASHTHVWLKLSTGDRETLPIVKDGINGDNTTIFQLAPTASAFVYGRDANNDLVAKVDESAIYVNEITGTSVTTHTSALTGYTIRYGYGSSSTPVDSGRPVGWTIQCNISWAETEDEMWVELMYDGSAIDRRTLPIMKNGENGQPGGQGPQGAGGWMVTADPANVILTQGLGTNTTSFSSQAVTFSAKRGNVDATIVSVLINHSTDANTEWYHFTGSVSGTTVTVTQPTIYTTSGVTNYYTEGYFIAKVGVRNPDDSTNTVIFYVKVPCYANLLGTWKREVMEGVETVTAQLTQYLEDEDGNIITSQSLRTDINDATQDLSELASTVTEQGTTIESQNTRLRTAETNISKIEKHTVLLDDENLLLGTKNPTNDDGYNGTWLFGSGCSIVTLTDSPITGYDKEFKIVGASGGNRSFTQYHTFISEMGEYRFSAYVKGSSTSVIGRFRIYQSATDGVTGHQVFLKTYSATTDWQLVTFDVTVSDYVDTDTSKAAINIGIQGSGTLKILAPTLVRITKDSKVSSQIRQTASEIELSIKDGLASTGILIDGENKRIEMMADKTVMKDSSGKEMICFEMYNDVPSLVFYDNNGKSGGNRTWVLNWQGLLQIIQTGHQASFTLLSIRGDLTGMTITGSEIWNVNGNLPDIVSRYIFNAGYTVDPQTHEITYWPANAASINGHMYDTNEFSDSQQTMPADDPDNNPSNGWYLSASNMSGNRKTYTLYEVSNGSIVSHFLIVWKMDVYDEISGQVVSSSYYIYCSDLNVDGDESMYIPARV